MEDPNATVDSALREAITDQDVDAVRRLLALRRAAGTRAPEVGSILTQVFEPTRRFSVYAASPAHELV